MCEQCDVMMGQLPFIEEIIECEQEFRGSRHEGDVGEVMKAQSRFVETVNRAGLMAAPTVIMNLAFLVNAARADAEHLADHLNDFADRISAVVAILTEQGGDAEILAHVLDMTVLMRELASNEGECGGCELDEQC